MVIAIGADHGGFLYKEKLITKLSKDHTIIDVGANILDYADDYTDFSFAVALAVASGKAQAGIMICRTGVGAVIAMNKVNGIRAGLCESEEASHIARAKNNINIVSFGADNVSLKKAEKIVNTFLSTNFDGGRHQKRIEKIMEFERTRK